MVNRRRRGDQAARARRGDTGGWQSRERGRSPMTGVPTSITAHFAALPDPRVARSKQHRLLDILTIALCPVLCGADGFVSMVTFAEAKEDWLRTFLALPGGIPCHDTFGRVFAALDPEAFQACFLAWVRATVPGTAGQVVPIDGKALRGAAGRGRRPCTWSAPGPARAAWCSGRSRWPRSRTRSSPSRPCCGCWTWPGRR